MTTLDDLIECARQLGITQSKRGFGIYTQTDARFEQAMHEAIAKHRAALAAPQDHTDWNRKIRDSVGSLLAQDGYAEDSSARHNLSLMNFDAQPESEPRYAAPQAVNAELSIYEQRAILHDLMGLECLINYHDCQETGADAMEPGWGRGNGRRALELLAMGRALIAEDPDLWHDEQKAAFVLRHSELSRRNHD